LGEGKGGWDEDGVNNDELTLEVCKTLNPKPLFLTLNPGYIVKSQTLNPILSPCDKFWHNGHFVPDGLPPFIDGHQNPNPQTPNPTTGQRGRVQGLVIPDGLPHCVGSPPASLVMLSIQGMGSAAMRDESRGKNHKTPNPKPQTLGINHKTRTLNPGC